MIPVLVREPELLASEVLVGKGGPVSKLFALKDEVQVWC